MSEYSSLKATINANVKTNGNQEITGSVMNSVLNAMVNSLGAGYQFIGVATPTNPGSEQTPDYKCFYIATTPGKYTNLGGLVVADGEVALLMYGTSWTKEVTGIATADQLNQLGLYVENNIVKNTQVFENIELSDWNVAPNYNVNISGEGYIVIAPLSGYTSYYKVLDKDMVFSANAIKNSYYAIAFGEDASPFNPPSGSNTSYIAATGATRVRKSENNLPSDSNPIVLHAGAIIVVSIIDENNSPRLIREVISSDEPKSDFVSIEFIDPYTFDINMGKYQVQLRHEQSVSNNADLWNLLALRCGDIQITQGDIIGPILEVGEDDFMGGVHGDEKTTLLSVSCDGFPYGMVGKSIGKKISIDMVSEIYRVSSKEHIYNRFVSIEITNGKIKVSNNFVALVTSTLQAADNGGLIDCRQELVTGVFMPNFCSDTAPTTQPNNSARCNTWGKINWVGGSIKAVNLMGKELDTYRGFDFVYASGGVVSRNKIYLALVEGTTKTLNPNDSICGIFEYVLD